LLISLFLGLFSHDRRLLRHHYRVLPRPDRRHVLVVRDRPLPAHRRQGEAY
jgi:hypothetical protein